jgi:hypothetical protein
MAHGKAYREILPVAAEENVDLVAMESMVGMRST